jgi:hypothetical protein
MHFFLAKGLKASYSALRGSRSRMRCSFGRARRVGSSASNPTFVYANQVFGRDRGDGPELDFAPLEVVFRTALGGVE